MSPKRPPSPESVYRIARALRQDAQSGDLDHSRLILRMADSEAARAALVQLGPSYVTELKACTAAQLDDLRGAGAAEAFIRDELRPIASRIPRNPPARKPTQKAGWLRRLRRNTAIIALGIGLGLPMLTHMDTPQSGMDAPATAAAPVDSAALAAMENLRQEFGRTALGRDMLEMANAHGITIAYDSNMTASGNAGLYNFYSKRITLDPAEPLAAQVMFLAHELRHAWQDVYLNYAGMEATMLTPRQQWTLRRYCEADAFAFSAYFMADRMRELPNAPVPEGNDREIPIARALHSEFSSADGLTNEEYRAYALNLMLDRLNGYTENHLKLADNRNTELEEALNNALATAKDGDLYAAEAELDDTAARMQTTPSQEAFEHYIRRFGGMSLEPQARTSLQGSFNAALQLLSDGAGTEQALARSQPKLPAVEAADISARLDSAETLNSTFRSLARELTINVKALAGIEREKTRHAEMAPKTSPRTQRKLPATEETAPKTGTQTSASHKIDSPAAQRIFPCRH